MKAVKLEEKVARLQGLIDAAPQARGPGWSNWRNEAATVLRHFLGDDNDFCQRFRKLSFTPRIKNVNCPNRLAEEQAFTNGVAGAKSLLRAGIAELKLIDELGTDHRPHDRQQGAEIFVVHGHNEAFRLKVVDFLTTATGVRPTVLLDEPNKGLTLFEKFEDVAGRACFAVVLATADDVGRAKSEKIDNGRARQNVILEWGYFAGRLGRNRVALMCEQDIELPSDTSGLVYIPLDSAGAWRFDLARELKAADIDVSLDRGI
jgi:predicted nucleotide-binding protein